MLAEFFSNLGNAIGGFFSWLWNGLIGWFSSTLNWAWNFFVDNFWSWYSTAINWLMSAIAYFFPDDSLTFNSNVNALVDYVAGWDQVLPIHEVFALLNILLLYHITKIVVHYSIKLVQLLRSLIPV